ncbi:MAG: hypothetical protein REI94_04580 [Moraxellaceae bacterium]|nr:hypothetical protein [Moraxellaceae bacterium]
MTSPRRVTLPAAPPPLTPTVEHRPARAHVPLPGRLALALLAAWQAGPAIAIGLGEARSSSRIGDQLRVEISVQPGPGESIEPDCFRLSTAGPAGEGLPGLVDGRLSLQSIGGTPTLVITSARPVFHPALAFAVRANCGAQLRRDYTLLLDPPAASSIAPATTEPVATAVAPTPPSPVPPAGKPATASNWITVEGESPANIAAVLYPDDRRMQRRFVQALRTLNPGLRGSADSPLPAGSELVIPDARAVARATPAPAPAAAPGAVTSSPATSRPETRTTEPPARRNQPAPAPVEASGADRLRVDSGGDASLRLSTIIESRQELGETERERLRTELQLIATLDEKITTQLELTEKLRQLEAMQARLQADATRLETQLQAQSQAAPVVAPVGAPVPARTSWMPGWLTADATRYGLFAALLVALLGGLGWRSYRRRRDAAGPATIPLPVASQASTEPDRDEDVLLAPLTAADIWPDQPQNASPVATATSTAIDGAVGPLSQASLGPASVLQIEDAAEEHDSAVELAEIMMSFGRVHGAAQTLAEFIRANPKQAVKPWIKLLEVYKAADMRAEFEALTGQLNKTFNVKPVTWDDFEVALRAPESLENIAHIRDKVCATWGKPECQAYLHELLRDNRQGTRQGFPLAIVDEMLLLLAILEGQLGAYRPDAPSDSPALEATPATPTLPVPAAAVGTSAWIPTNSKTLDFELDMSELSNTLNINLDDLDPLEPDEPPKP